MADLVPHDRPRRRGIVALGSAALAAALLPGCDGGSQSTGDGGKYSPQRPTDSGSISHSVRAAGERAGDVARRAVSSAPGTQTGDEIPAPTPPSPTGPSSPRSSLEPGLRATLVSYTESIDALNAALAGVNDQVAPAEAMRRLSPLVDKCRSILDQLLVTPEEARPAIAREFGPRLRASARAFRAHTDRISGRPGLEPVANLIADLPILD